MEQHSPERHVSMSSHGDGMPHWTAHFWLPHQPRHPLRLPAAQSLPPPGNSGLSGSKRLLWTHATEAHQAQQGRGGETMPQALTLLLWQPRPLLQGYIRGFLLCGKESGHPLAIHQLSRVKPTYCQIPVPSAFCFGRPLTTSFRPGFHKTRPPQCFQCGAYSGRTWVENSI